MLQRASATKELTWLFIWVHIMCLYHCWSQGQDGMEKITLLEVFLKSILKLVIRLETVGDKHWEKFVCVIVNFHIGSRTENSTLLCFSQISTFCVLVFNFQWFYILKTSPSSNEVTSFGFSYYLSRVSEELGCDPDTPSSHTFCSQANYYKLLPACSCWRGTVWTISVVCFHRQPNTTWNKTCQGKNVLF